MPAYQMTPPCDLSSTPLYWSGTSSFLIFSDMSSCHADRRSPRTCPQRNAAELPSLNTPEDVPEHRKKVHPPSRGQPARERVRLLGIPHGLHLWHSPPPELYRDLIWPSVGQATQYNGGTRPRVSKHWGIWLSTRVRGWWLWGGCQGPRWGFSWKTHV